MTVEESTKISRKRVADHQLSKDDYEENQDSDGETDNVAVGELPKASAQVLQQRRIVRVPRNANGDWDASRGRKKGSEAPAETTTTASSSSATTTQIESKALKSSDSSSGPAPSNPFANVQLKANDDKDSKEEETKDATTATKAKVFGASSGFSGFGQAANASSSGGFFGTAGKSAGSSSGFGFGTSNSSFAGFASTSKTSGGFGSFASASATKADTTTSTIDAKDAAATTSTTVEPAGTTTIASNTAVVDLPQQYELRSGEEEETVLLEQRCKTHRWESHSVDATKATSDKDAPPPSAKAAAIPSVPPSSGLFGSNAAEGKSTNKEDADESKDPPADSVESNEAKTRATELSKDVKPEMRWHEAGTGPLRVLKKTNDESSGDSEAGYSLRLVQRRETSPCGPATKVIINVPLWKESTFEKPSEKHVKVNTVNAHGKTTTLLCKFKTSMDADQVFELLKKQCENANSMVKSNSTNANPVVAKEPDDDAKKESVDKS